MCGAFFMAAFKACFEERTEKSPMPCEARRDFLFVAPRKTSWITESNPAKTPKGVCRPPQDIMDH
jgi:hypothetical protein